MSTYVWIVRSIISPKLTYMWIVRSIFSGMLMLRGVAGEGGGRAGQGGGGSAGDGEDGDGSGDVPTTLPSGQTPRPSCPGTKYPVRGNSSRRYHKFDFALKLLFQYTIGSQTKYVPLNILHSICTYFTLFCQEIIVRKSKAAEEVGRLRQPTSYAGLGS